MEWISPNWFFVVILLLCVGMHLFHGHAGGRHRRHDDS